eukprot:snap_masked-scaffold_7-processed-gene-7.26-mRNA-1 protein AED:1.00 eAED:1.00 QI:0/0/0/0/1/1/2/0/2171
MYKLCGIIICQLLIRISNANRNRTLNHSHINQSESVLEKKKEDFSICAQHYECKSNYCFFETNICLPSSCINGKQDGNETDVDCGGPCPSCALGENCLVDKDCKYGYCDPENLLCVPETCWNGVQDGNETDVDCGGPCAGCELAKACLFDKDCLSKFCSKDGLCRPNTCSNGVLDSEIEVDIDCGLSCGGCEPGKKCFHDADCLSNLCFHELNSTFGTCLSETCSDYKLNGEETDVDCGGLCAPCKIGQTCMLNADCSPTLICNPRSQQCAPASCFNGLLDVDESDTDCGGVCSNYTKCKPMKKCWAQSDCFEGDCVSGTCLSWKCLNGVQDELETDIDCGGGECGSCDVFDSCVTTADCGSHLVCHLGQCLLESCFNNVKDGLETDIDCGGRFCSQCSRHKTCRMSSDCAAGLCYNGTCYGFDCFNGLQEASDESDVDCGGSCRKCEALGICNSHEDCATDLSCDSETSRCLPNDEETLVKLCIKFSCDFVLYAPRSCSDGVQNNNETDADCGGTECKPCDNLKTCVKNNDCNSGICEEVFKICVEETCFNEMQDGEETDVDCGGTDCLPCKEGLTCSRDNDCRSGFCNPNSASCTSPDEMKFSFLDCDGIRFASEPCLHSDDKNAACLAHWNDNFCDLGQKTVEGSKFPNLACSEFEFDGSGCSESVYETLFSVQFDLKKLQVLNDNEALVEAVSEVENTMVMVDKISMLSANKYNNLHYAIELLKTANSRNWIGHRSVETTQSSYIDRLARIFSFRDIPLPEKVWTCRNLEDIQNLVSVLGLHNSTYTVARPSGNIVLSLYSTGNEKIRFPSVSFASAGDTELYIELHGQFVLLNYVFLLEGSNLVLHPGSLLVVKKGIISDIGGSITMLAGSAIHGTKNSFLMNLGSFQFTPAADRNVRGAVILLINVLNLGKTHFQAEVNLSPGKSVFNAKGGILIIDSVSVIGGNVFNYGYCEIISTQLSTTVKNFGVMLLQQRVFVFGSFRSQGIIVTSANAKLVVGKHGIFEVLDYEDADTQNFIAEDRKKYLKILKVDLSEYSDLPGLLLAGQLEVDREGSFSMAYSSFLAIPGHSIGATGGGTKLFMENADGIFILPATAGAKYDLCLKGESTVSILVADESTNPLGSIEKIGSNTKVNKVIIQSTQSSAKNFVFESVSARQLQTENIFKQDATLEGIVYFKEDQTIFGEIVLENSATLIVTSAVTVVGSFHNSGQTRVLGGTLVILGEFVSTGNLEISREGSLRVAGESTFEGDIILYGSLFIGLYNPYSLGTVPNLVAVNTSSCQGSSTFTLVYSLGLDIIIRVPAELCYTDTLDEIKENFFPKGADFAHSEFLFPDKNKTLADYGLWYTSELLVQFEQLNWKDTVSNVLHLLHEWNGSISFHTTFSSMNSAVSNTRDALVKIEKNSFLDVHGSLELNGMLESRGELLINDDAHVGVNRLRSDNTTTLGNLTVYSEAIFSGTTVSVGHMEAAPKSKLFFERHLTNAGELVFHSNSNIFFLGLLDHTKSGTLDSGGDITFGESSKANLNGEVLLYGDVVVAGGVVNIESKSFFTDSSFYLKQGSALQARRSSRPLISSLFMDSTSTLYVDNGAEMFIESKLVKYNNKLSAGGISFGGSLQIAGTLSLMSNSNFHVNDVVVVESGLLKLDDKVKAQLRTVFYEGKIELYGKGISVTIAEVCKGIGTLLVGSSSNLIVSSANGQVFGGRVMNYGRIDVETGSTAAETVSVVGTINNFGRMKFSASTILKESFFNHGVSSFFNGLEAQPNSILSIANTSSVSVFVGFSSQGTVSLSGELNVAGETNFYNHLSNTGILNIESGATELKAGIHSRGLINLRMAANISFGGRSFISGGTVFEGIAVLAPESSLDFSSGNSSLSSYTEISGRFISTGDITVSSYFEVRGVFSSLQASSLHILYEGLIRVTDFGRLLTSDSVLIEGQLQVDKGTVQVAQGFWVSTFESFINIQDSFTAAKGASILTKGGIVIGTHAVVHNFGDLTIEGDCALGGYVENEGNLTFRAEVCHQVDSEDLMSMVRVVSGTVDSREKSLFLIDFCTSLAVTGRLLSEGSLFLEDKAELRIEKMGSLQYQPQLSFFPKGSLIVDKSASVKSLSLPEVDESDLATVQKVASQKLSFRFPEYFLKAYHWLVNTFISGIKKKYILKHFNQYRLIFR